MDPPDTGENQTKGSTFRGIGNESHSSAENLVDNSRTAYRSHDDSENEAPPVKRLQLTETVTRPSDRSNVSKKPKMYFDWLNKKTLVKIFDQLDLYDLLQMADEDKRIEQIIGEEIMSSRVLNISEISPNYSVRHAFKHFGPFASAVVIKQSDIQWKKAELSKIEEIVRLIGKRCTEGKLKKLSITFDSIDCDSYKLNIEVSECFKTLESLEIMKLQSIKTIHCTVSFENFDRCLESLLGSCSGLQSLRLNRITSDGKFFTALKTIKLQELLIENCYITESKFWLELVQSGIPSLKKLKCQFRRINGIEIWYEIFNHIGTAFRNVEELCFDTETCKIQKFINFTKVPQIHLKVLRLGCSWLNHFVPEALSQLPHLHVLHIDFDESCGIYGREANKTDWKTAMQRLTNLQAIKFEFDSAHRHLHQSWDTIIDLVANLPNVRQVEFKGNRSINRKDIKNIVSCSPKIDTLKLDVLIRSFTPEFYNTLVRNRSLWHRNSPQICIYMDAKTVNILKESIDEYASKANCIRLCPLSQV